MRIPGDTGHADHADHADLTDYAKERSGIHESGCLARWLPGTLAWVLLVGACAKVGDPIPPEVRPVDPPTDLTIIQRGANLLVLEFTVPAGAREIDVLGGCGGEALVSLLTLPTDGLQPAEGGPGRRRLELTGRPPQPCQYAVRVQDRRFGRSAPTPPVMVRWTEPPPCPRNPHAEVFPDHLLLRWDPPETTSVPVAGYLVNRRHLVFDTRFRIEGVSFGIPLSFSVDTVARVGNPMVVSADCGEVRLIPRDTFPPAVPEGLRAVRLPSGIQLLWDPVTDPDLKGYRVYRREGSGARSVAADLVPANQYFDGDVAPHQLVYYEVTAVDQQGNESAPSAEVEVPPEVR